jgi:hypothetical protein
MIELRWDLASQYSVKEKLTFFLKSTIVLENYPTRMAEKFNVVLTKHILFEI